MQSSLNFKLTQVELIYYENKGALVLSFRKSDYEI